MHIKIVIAVLNLCMILLSESDNEDNHEFCDAAPFASFFFGRPVKTGVFTFNNLATGTDLLVPFARKHDFPNYELFDCASFILFSLTRTVCISHFVKTIHPYLVMIVMT